MGKQFIVAISREYASGGHDIGEEIAKRLGVEFYDHNLLDVIAEKKGMDVSNLKPYDELAHKRFFTRRVRGHSNSPEEAIAQIQFDFLREKADAGESFVIVGRCAESILAAYPGLISIFVSAKVPAKIERVMRLRDMDKKTAKATMKRHDTNRKAYHNHFCSMKWGDSRGYDICINSTSLGIEGTTDYLEQFIKAKIEHDA